MFKLRRCTFVNDCILRIFSTISDNRIHAIALTHSPSGKIGAIDRYEILRIEQLKSVNVDFSKSAQYFNNVSFPDIKSEYGVPLLHEGIICTAYIDKGIVLKKVLEKLNYKPKKIIFIDDRIDNLTSVESICIDLEIELIGLEYTAVKDSDNTPFNGMRAKLQFETLAQERIWLSDT